MSQIMVTTKVQKKTKLSISREDFLEMCRAAGHDVASEAEIHIEDPYRRQTDLDEDCSIIVQWTTIVETEE